MSLTRPSPDPLQQILDDTAEPRASKTLSSEAFLSATNAAISRCAVALDLFRRPADRHDESARFPGEAIRSRDFIGAYGVKRSPARRRR